MNIFDHMDIAGSTIPIDAARWITDFHEKIRELVEEHFKQEYSVFHISEQSTTRYMTTFASAASPHPEYILAEAVATFHIDLTENKPVESEYDVRMKPLKCLSCTATLFHDGKLLITGRNVSIPSRR